MVTKDDAGPLLCAECAALPAIDGLRPFHGMCGRCGEVLPGDPAPVDDGAEDDIERARRGPVPAVAPCMTREQAAVIAAAESYVDSIGKGARPSVADLSQAVATMRAAVAPILARYAREIDAARARGHVVTAGRIEAERDEYQEAGQ